MFFSGWLAFRQERAGRDNRQREFGLWKKRESLGLPFRHPNKSGLFCSLWLAVISLHEEQQAPGVGTQRLESSPAEMRMQPFRS